MPVTLNCTQVGQANLWNKSAFDDCAIHVANCYKQLENQVFLGLQVFCLRKDAAEFCSRWNLPKSGIRPVHSRWQRGYAIDLGRSSFVPDHAECRLIAHAMGCIVNNIT